MRSGGSPRTCSCAMCPRGRSPFEDASAVSFVDAGPVVAQFDDRGVAAASERDFDGGAFRGVCTMLPMRLVKTTARGGRGRRGR